jgi:hypothetical protein
LPPPFAEAAAVAGKIATALHDLRHRHVIRLDIKRRNGPRSGERVQFDFGLSRHEALYCAAEESFGIARHWHRVLRIDMIPFMTSRTLTRRLLPPVLAPGINGST